MHGSEPPSAWVQRWSHLVPPGGTVLDVACGHGRHLRWFASRGHAVTGVDRSPEAVAAATAAPTMQAAAPATVAASALAPARGMAPSTRAAHAERARVVQADIESGLWPFPGQRFDAVVVTNYLWRSLLPVLVDSVAEGGVLLYETFAVGNATVGKPSRPDFLLRPGELLQAAEGLHTVAYEDGFCNAPERFVQRIAAVRKRPSPTDPPARLLLSGSAGGAG